MEGAENGANAAYSGSPATAYTNADRSYSVELYRVTGGGTLGSDTSAKRTMAKGSGYTVGRSNYTEKSIVNVAETSEKNGKKNC